MRSIVASVAGWARAVAAPGLCLVAVALLVQPVPGLAAIGSVDALDRRVQEVMAAQGVPGVGLAIIDGYEVVSVRSYGIAEPGRRIDADTLFQAASLSKPPSAVIAAAVAEDGLIDLDADVTDMLTSWRLPPTPYDVPVTLRMLFAHRAGTNVPGFPGYRLDEPLPDLPRILAGVRDKNEPIRVVAEPGNRREYSGGGYLVAQLAIEDQTGQTWEDLADAILFEPLALDRSTYRLRYASDRSHVAVGHRADGTEVAGGGWHQYPETAAASLWTTPAEYATFVVDVMRSYTTGTGTILQQQTARSLLDPDFSVGFGVSREQGGIAIGHEGANEGYRTAFLALPHLGQGVVVMTNSDNGLVVTSAIIDDVAEQFGWPWTGWRTPWWAVAAAGVVLVALFTATVRVVISRRRQHRRSAESVT